MTGCPRNIVKRRSTEEDVHYLRGKANLSTVTLHGTPWKTNMDPENHWLVEENTLPVAIGPGSMLVFGSVMGHTQLLRVFGGAGKSPRFQIQTQ